MPNCILPLLRLHTKVSRIWWQLLVRGKITGGKTNYRFQSKGLHPIILRGYEVKGKISHNAESVDKKNRGAFTRAIQTCVYTSTPFIITHLTEEKNRERVSACWQERERELKREERERPHERYNCNVCTRASLVFVLASRNRERKVRFRFYFSFTFFFFIRKRVVKKTERKR